MVQSIRQLPAEFRAHRRSNYPRLRWLQDESVPVSNFHRNCSERKGLLGTSPKRWREKKVKQVHSAECVLKT